MNQTAKDVAADFRKSVINWLVVTIAPTLWVGAATATWWGSLLSLSEDRVSSIRYWLLFVSSTALILVSWFLYIRAVRKIRSVEQELAIANTSLLLPLVEAAIADGKIADSSEVRASLDALRIRVHKSQDDAQATRKYFGVG